jgi:hypothetical protein
MQKYKFGITYLDALFMETAPSPPKLENYCVDVPHPGRTESHYVNRRSHWI